MLKEISELTLRLLYWESLFIMVKCSGNQLNAKLNMQVCVKGMIDFKETINLNAPNINNSDLYI